MGGRCRERRVESGGGWGVGGGSEIEKRGGEGRDVQ